MVRKLSQSLIITLYSPKGRKPVFCFNCRQPGHMASQCPNPQQQQQTDERKGKSNQDYDDY